MHDFYCRNDHILSFNFVWNLRFWLKIQNKESIHLFVSYDVMFDMQFTVNWVFMTKSNEKRYHANINRMLYFLLFFCFNLICNNAMYIYRHYYWATSKWIFDKFEHEHTYNDKFWYWLELPFLENVISFGNWLPKLYSHDLFVSTWILVFHIQFEYEHFFQLP